MSTDEMDENNKLIMSVDMKVPQHPEFDLHFRVVVGCELNGWVRMPQPKKNPGLFISVEFRKPEVL